MRYEEWQLDQAMVGHPSGPIFAAYTPEGIRQLDSEFCQRILSAKTVADFEQIEKDIWANPHLHTKIKSNLLLNLHNARPR